MIGVNKLLQDQNEEKDLDEQNFNIKFNLINEEFTEFFVSLQYHKQLFIQKSDKYCQACYKMFDPTKDFKIFLQEKGQQMLICYGCEVCVHLYCYGLNTNYKQTTNSKKSSYYMFLCDKCRAIQPDSKQEKKCIVCKNSNNALKQLYEIKNEEYIKSNNFIHITCALFCKDVECIDLLNMKFALKNENFLIKSIDGPGCAICGEKYGLVKCSEESCQSYAHINCVLDEKNQEQLENQNIIQKSFC